MSESGSKGVMQLFVFCVWRFKLLTNACACVTDTNCVMLLGGTKFVLSWLGRSLFTHLIPLLIDGWLAQCWSLYSSQRTLMYIKVKLYWNSCNTRLLTKECSNLLVRSCRIKLRMKLIGPLIVLNKNNPVKNSGHPVLPKQFNAVRPSSVMPNIWDNPQKMHKFSTVN